MKKKALLLDWIREIKNSLPRFISLVFLVALGVAFFAGIRVTKPDMKRSVDKQYDEDNFMDFRVLSTQGLTKEDVTALEKVKGVKQVEPSYTKDVLCHRGNQEFAIKVYAKTDKINQIYLKKGRTVKKTGECVVDSYFAKENNIKIGENISLISGDEDKLSDCLKKTKFIVVGMADYNYYLTRSKGTTSIGTGNLNGFLMIPKEDFKQDVYTEIYVTVDGAKECTTYTKEYNDVVKSVTKRVEAIKKEREEIRFEEIKKEAKKEIKKAEKKYNKEKKKADKKLLAAKKDLESAKADIDKNEAKLRDAKRKIDLAWSKWEAGKREYERGKKQIPAGKKQLKKAKSELSSGKKTYQKNKEKFEKSKKPYEKAKADYTANARKLKQSKKQLELAASQYGLTLSQLTSQQGDLYEQYQGYLAGKKQLDQGKKKLDSAKRQLNAGERKLRAAKKRLDSAQSKISREEKKLKQAQSRLRRAKRQLDSSKKSLQRAKHQYESGKDQLASGKRKYEKGLKTYESNKKKADKKFKKAKHKINEAKEDVKKIKKGKWYLLNRNTIQSYVEYGQDSDRIGAIGKVFPLIFFLVAALVSLTTMTRMVEKERTQLGTMKALGYGKLQIAGKYLCYAVLATTIGSVLGIAVGQKVLPQIIITAYAMMYTGVHEVVTPIQLDIGLMAAGMAFISTIGATLFACYRSLAEVPASLMRPEAPKEGKRVLLERIPFLWRKIPFSWKSSIRNLLRYKKRFFMTLIGIGGCMSLLLVGFGLSDSIAAITKNQYKKIYTYDATVFFDEDNRHLQEDMKKVSKKEGISSSMEMRVISMTVEHKKKSKTATVEVPMNRKELNSYVHFQNRTSGESYELGKEGAIVTEKMASLLDIKVGDTISLKEGDTKTVKVKVFAIMENYLNHAVFLSKQQYEKLYKEKMTYNALICKTKSKQKSWEDNLSQDLLKLKSVNSISYVSEVEKEMADMLGNLDIVVFVLIFSAGLLAFVVLYNLNNINIEERRRELATIKVLGFYQRELAAYVYRENILLTLIGIFVGIFMGIGLHRYVILTAEVDAIMFGRQIDPSSYGYSIAFTILFAIIINALMYVKLKGIDMVESLKSVE